MSGGEDDMVADMKKIRGEITEMHVAFLSTLTGRSDPYVMHKEFIALRAEMWQMKEEREAERITWQNEREKQEADYKKVCDELAALKLKQAHDAAAIRAEAAEMKKKQEAQDVKLQNHEKGLSIRKETPIEEMLVGKWKLVSSTGREEYEKLMISYDNHSKDRAKISYNNRSFTYNGGILESFVGTNDIDTAFSKNYTVNNRRLIFRSKPSGHFDQNSQLINISIENNKLFVNAGIVKGDSGAEFLAICKCYYDRA